MDRKAVRVKWSDPYSIDEWTEIDEIPKLMFVESFGYEIYRDSEKSVIALNYDPSNDKASCITVIPDECIKSYEYYDVDE